MAEIPNEPNDLVEITGSEHKIGQELRPKSFFRYIYTPVAGLQSLMAFVYAIRLQNETTTVDSCPSHRSRLTRHINQLAFPLSR